MGAISFNNKLYPVGGTPSASMSVYDNSDSGLEATNVQDAIDELAEGGGGGGGHTIIDDTGTAVAQRSKLQFGDYDLTDDSENDITKVDLVKPEEVTWANYQQLTPAQKAGKQFYVPDYPSIGGVFFFQTEAAMQAAEATLPDNAVCIVWEDDPYVVTADVVEYDNTDSGLEADNIQDAIDEIDGKLSDYPTSISPDDGYVSYVKKNGICTVAVAGGITSRTITLPDAFMPCNYLSCSGYYDNTRALLYANNGHPTLDILSNGYDTYMTLSYVATS